MLERFKDLLDNEPVRLRWYPILLAVLAYAVTKGYVDFDAQSLILTVAGILAGSAAIENTRGSVYAPAHVK